MNPYEVYKAHLEGGIASDIGQHLPTLRMYAKGNVFEIGVRGGLSTAALLCGVKDKGGHVWSIDINGECGNLYRNDPDWSFAHAHSVKDAERIKRDLPEVLDVLFIDSDHSYDTTIAELRLYAPMLHKDTGIALLHDTDLQGAGVRDAMYTFRDETHCGLSFIEGSYGLGIVGWGDRGTHDLDDTKDRFGSDTTV
jgi:predicted O-methyltransferase YrrM